jgi:hypothetical protein
MGRWLARLSFSFFIVAAVLIWEVVRSEQRRGPLLSPGQKALYVAGACAGVMLGLAGVKERHKGDRQP